MSCRAAVGLLAVASALLAALAVSYYLAYGELERRYNSLMLDYDTLRQAHESLAHDYAELRRAYMSLAGERDRLEGELRELLRNYEDLKGEYSALMRDYEDLESKYSALMYNYSALARRYGALLDAAIKMNVTLARARGLLDSYTHLEDALPRVLSDDEIDATTPALIEAGVSPGDFWASVGAVYRWIRQNVKYASDVEMPYFCNIYRVLIGDSWFLYNASLCTVKQYYQAPSLTLRIRHGDCDDQAVLAYAMLKYYMRRVHGREYALYIMYVHMHNGSAHLAVVLPVAGGLLTIVDPAGSYLTSDEYGRITARPALEELERYSKHWPSFGGVQRIELWEVQRGRAQKVASGTIEEIARFLTSWA
jgi:hypothetical protein